MGVKSNHGHTVRQPAPEVLFKNIPASKQADVFASEMVVVGVRTIFCEHYDVNIRFLGRRLVFPVGARERSSHNAISTAVISMVANEERPPRPQRAERSSLSDPLWKTAECF